jgi:hypothetical protein
VAVERNRRAIRLVRTNFQFPILAHFLDAAEGVVGETLRGEIPVALAGRIQAQVAGRLTGRQGQLAQQSSAGAMRVLALERGSGQ